MHMWNFGRNLVPNVSVNVPAKETDNRADVRTAGQTDDVGF